MKKYAIEDLGTVDHIEFLSKTEAFILIVDAEGNEWRGLITNELQQE